MRRTFGLALLGALCLGGPASAQRYYDYDSHAGGAFNGDPELLVRTWYRRYLNRTPDRAALEMWIRHLREGQPPENLLGSVLGTQPYYDKAGDNPDGFARVLFLDIAGREPTPQEYEWVRGRLAYDDSEPERGQLAHDLLVRYPQAVYPAPQPGPGLRPGPAPLPVPGPRERDRDRDRDRDREREEREHHEYRRPDWRYHP